MKEQETVDCLPGWCPHQTEIVTIKQSLVRTPTMVVKISNKKQENVEFGWYEKPSFYVSYRKKAITILLLPKLLETVWILFLEFIMMYFLSDRGIFETHSHSYGSKK